MERLLYWIRERESIRLKKEAGEPKPWTDDDILQRYRFCNARRMDDKVSRWLLENWYEPYRDHPNTLYAVALARFVNLPSSLVLVTPFLYHDDLPHWGSIRTVLRKAKEKGAVFNGAYMVRGNTTISEDKIGTVVDEYIGALVKANVNVDTSSMERTHERIAAVYGFGSFMAGQVVADLRWAMSGEWTDRMTWAPMGPGSLRGINRLCEKPIKASMSAEEFLGKLRGVKETCYKKLPVGIMHRIELMDLQNCMCEYDKYNRALSGEGKPKMLYAGVK